MGVGYKAVLWNKHKKCYDLFILGGILFYLSVFALITFSANPFVRPETIVIRGTGSLAFIMLHFILIIGPLARLNDRFLPLVYNRRHFGVMMFLVAAVHGIFSIIQFHSLGDVNPIISILVSNTFYDTPSRYPFQPLGFFALLILFVMAATSHDFWLRNLSPRMWKSLHMMVYIAYALLVGHVVFGILQYESYPLRYVLLIVGVVVVVSLHLSAGLRWRRVGALRERKQATDFVPVCHHSEIDENRARIVHCRGQEIAIFKHDGKLSAVHNLCKHQNGPLGEGKIVDGCITCPWHGYQYLPGNGQAPVPFKEKVSTYQLKIDQGLVLVNPKPLGEGVPVEPVIIQEKKEEVRRQQEFYVGYLRSLPSSFRRPLKIAVGVTLVVLMLSAVIIGTNQQPFNDGVFELGKETSLTGFLHKSPVPHLVVKNAEDPPLAVLLVGFGKAGALGTIEAMENELGDALNDRQVTLSGTLIYAEGKVMLELTNHEQSLSDARDSWQDRTNPVPDGRRRITGEIVDPKCYFGVMKPGEGKTHRACATRCISGGIPPVIRFVNDNGVIEHAVLLNDRGENHGSALLNFVAEPVAVDGEFYRLDDWLIIHAATSSIDRLK